MEEKLLIIGAGIGQVPLLQKAKQKGICVAVATRPGNYPCVPLADEVIFTDIYERERIAEEAGRRGVTAVTSDQNDLMMPTAAFVAERLGLPGNRFSTVMTYCNKNRFRDLCEEVGVPVPRHMELTDDNADVSFDAPFPWIIKPADSQSSIAVTKVDNPEDFQAAKAEAIKRSPTHGAILEEFVPGSEIVCEGFISEGKYYLLAFADRRYFDFPGLFIPSQTIFPSTTEAGIQKRILEYERRLAAWTKPSFAIVHSEYLVNEETGEIRIVESALRGGGVYISSDLIPMCTGIDINEILLNKALGKEVDIDRVFAARREKAAAYVCFCLPEGIVVRAENAEKIEAFPFVSKAFLDDIRPGMRAEKMTYKGARKGPILVSGNTRQELEEHIEAVQKTLKIEIRKDDGTMTGIVWG